MIPTRLRVLLGGVVFLLAFLCGRVDGYLEGFNDGLCQAGHARCQP